MTQSNDEQIARLKKIQRLRSKREQRMAEYVKLMQGFANGGDDDAKERTRQLLHAIRKLDDEIEVLLQR